MDDTKERPNCRSHGGLVGVMDDENQKRNEDDFNAPLDFHDEVLRVAVCVSRV